MLSKALEKAAGWVFVATLLVAPFAYGGTTDGAIRLLNLLLFSGTLVWVAALLTDRRLPHLPWLPVVATTGLLIQGWLMAWNAHSILDPEFWEFVPRDPPVPLLPGSWDAVGSRTLMLRLSALLPAFLAIMDLCRRTRWIVRFVRTMAIAGVLLAALGIWQKAAVHPLKIWDVERIPWTAFGTYWYHGNAAAMLNLCWPLALGCAIWCFASDGAHLSRSLWILGAGLTTAGLGVNASKAGHAIAAALVLLCLVMLALRLREVLAKFGWRQTLVYGGVAAVAAAWIILQIDPTLSLKRWQAFLAREEWDSRFQIADACLDLLPGVSLFGTGPGTFVGVFQTYAAQHGMKLNAIWKYAHNDYLQAAVEWGVPGTLAWLALWLGGLQRGLRWWWEIVKPGLMAVVKRSRRSRERWRRSMEAMRQFHLTVAAFSLAGLLVHAAFDFPLQIYSIQIYGLTLVAALTSTRSSSSEERGDADPRSTHWKRHRRFRSLVEKKSDVFDHAPH